LTVVSTQLGNNSQLEYRILKVQIMTQLYKTGMKFVLAFVLLTALIGVDIAMPAYGFSLNTLPSVAACEPHVGSCPGP
jgi:hypothetical protein